MDKVPKNNPISAMPGLRESFINMKGGVAPGCGGLRQEFLTVIGLKSSKEGMRWTEEFGMKYLCGNLPGWFYVCWLTVQCVPLFKNSLKTAIRPLGLRNPLVKQFHREVSQSNKETIKEFVEPQQLVLSEGRGVYTCFHSKGGYGVNTA